MTGGALAPDIVLPLGLVAGQTEGPVGREQGDGRGGMAGVTLLMGEGQVFAVRGPQLGTGVAGGAGLPGGVVIPVAVAARPCRRGRRQGHRLGVALDAPEPVVDRMGEPHRAAPGRAVPDRDADRQGYRLGALSRIMAGGAIGLQGPLVMTDLTASRGFEGEPAVLGAGRVTGDAGEAGVARVGEGVSRRRREDRRQDG